MKNRIIETGIYMLLAVLATGWLASCGDDIHDFAKKTDSDAANAVYIADSIFNFQVYRSADEDITGDVILAKFPVYSTLVAENDVKVTLAIDNDLVKIYNAHHGTAYNALLSSSWQLEHATLTIPKGQTVSSDSIGVSYKGLLKNLSDRKGYILPVKIISYAGTDVKIDYEERVTYLKINVSQQNGIYFKELESTGKITNNPALNIFNNLNTMDFTLYSFFETDDDVTVSLLVNNSLIAAFNSRMGTNYQAIPATDFDPVAVTLQSGTIEATGEVPYKGDISTLTDTRGYVVPLEITSVAGGAKEVNAQKVFYAIMDISDLHCDYVTDESELGVKVTDRSKYNVVRFVDKNGVDKKPVPGVSVAPGTDVDAYLNSIFQDTGWMMSGFSGNNLDMTIDLGEEVQNITGLRLSATLASNTMKGVDIYYASGAEYAAGITTLAGIVDRGAATQNMNVKISKPITARYIRLYITPSSAAIRINSFYLYTGN